MAENRTLLAPLALLGAPAAAGEVEEVGTYITKVGQEIEVHNGSWVRAFPTPPVPVRGDTGGAPELAWDGSWFITTSGGGDYFLRTMEADYSMPYNGIPITGQDFLIDHGLDVCPDGSILHIGHVNDPVLGHAAYALRYTNDFSEILAQSWIAGDTPGLLTNDAYTHCSEAFQGALYLNVEERQTLLYHVGEDAHLSGVDTIFEGPHSTGASMVYEPETDTFVVFSFPVFFVDPDGGGVEPKYLGYDHKLYLYRLSRDFELIDYREIRAGDPGDIIFWTMSAKRIEQVYVVVHQVQEDGTSFRGDSGNLWLQVLDRDWNLLETVRVTSDLDGDGYNRPGLTLHGDTLMLGYDQVTKGRLREITLDLGRMANPDPPPGPWWDTGGGGDSAVATGAGGGGDSAVAARAPPPGIASAPGGAPAAEERRDTAAPAAPAEDPPEGKGCGCGAAPTPQAAWLGPWWLALAAACRARCRGRRRGPASAARRAAG